MLGSPHESEYVGHLGHVMGLRLSTSLMFLGGRVGHLLPELVHPACVFRPWMPGLHVFVGGSGLPVSRLVFSLAVRVWLAQVQASLVTRKGVSPLCGLPSPQDMVSLSSLSRGSACVWVLIILLSFSALVRELRNGGLVACGLLGASGKCLVPGFWRVFSPAIVSAIFSTLTWRHLYPTCGLRMHLMYPAV